MRKFGWQVGQDVTLRGHDLPGEPHLRDRRHRSRRGRRQPARPVVQPQVPRGGDGVAAAGSADVGMIWLRAERARARRAASCAHVDALFRNSEARGRRRDGEVVLRELLRARSGPSCGVIIGVGFLVVGAVVLIAANTSAMGIRERIPEIAVLKSLGFRRRPILAALLAESTLQGLIGGLVGAGRRLRPLRARSRAPGRPAHGQLLGPLGQLPACRPAVARRGRRHRARRRARRGLRPGLERRAPQRRRGAPAPLLIRWPSRSPTTSGASSSAAGRASSPPAASRSWSRRRCCSLALVGGLQQMLVVERASPTTWSCSARAPPTTARARCRATPRRRCARCRASRAAPTGSRSRRRRS